MKCLVTGAAGFIGSELARALIANKYEVRAFLKNGESTENLSGVPVEIVYGDVTDKTSLKKAMAGIECVFHTASLYDMTFVYQHHAKKIFEINVEGTRNVCEAAIAAGVKKLIYTGSTGAIGCIKNQPTDETMEFNMFSTRSNYEKSKALGEKMALSFHGKGLQVVVIDPSFLVGPRDSRPSPTGELIIKFLNHRYPVYFNAPLTLSEMRGTIQAHLNAIESGESGQRYIVTSDRHMTVKEFFQILENVSGISRPKLQMPFWTLKIFSISNELAIGFLHLIGIKKPLRPLIAYDLVRYFTQGCLYNPAKAMRALHYTPDPIEKAIAESVVWYVEHGYIKKSSCKKYYAHQQKIAATR